MNILQPPPWTGTQSEQSLIKKVILLSHLTDEKTEAHRDGPPGRPPEGAQLTGGLNPGLWEPAPRGSGGT